MSLPEEAKGSNCEQEGHGQEVVITVQPTRQLGSRIQLRTPPSLNWPNPGSQGQKLPTPRQKRKGLGVQQGFPLAAKEIGNPTETEPGGHANPAASCYTLRQMGKAPPEAPQGSAQAKAT